MAVQQLLQPHRSDRDWLEKMAELMNQTVVELAADHSEIAF